MSREKLVIFALDQKLDWATVTLILTSAPKFQQLLCQYILISTFDFGMKQKLCPKILIAGFGHSQRSTLLNELLLKSWIMSHCVSPSVGGLWMMLFYPLTFTPSESISLKKWLTWRDKKSCYKFGTQLDKIGTLII